MLSIAGRGTGFLMFAVLLFLTFLQATRAARDPLATQAARILTTMKHSPGSYKRNLTLDEQATLILNSMEKSSESYVKVSGAIHSPGPTSLRDKAIVKSKEYELTAISLQDYAIVNRPHVMNPTPQHPVRLCPETLDTLPGLNSDPTEPLRARRADRDIWFIQCRTPNSKHMSYTGAASEIIQRIVGLGPGFTEHSYGLSAKNCKCGVVLTGTSMLFSNLLKAKDYTAARDALQKQGLCNINAPVPMDADVGNTLVVALGKRGIMFRSFGNPPLAAVLLRAEDGQYKPILTSEDGTSVEKTLKPQDVIVVGMCKTVWSGLSFPADSSLEDIVSSVVNRDARGMAVAAIIR
jgi:hypothetical protein